MKLWEIHDKDNPAAEYEYMSISLRTQRKEDGK